MHKATLDLQKGMKHCKRIWNNYYILKVDLKKYFENINKNILYEILERKIKDKKVIWLTKEIIYSNKGETGLPIGNYTSQLFANVYLNELDQYIKHQLKCKYYFRYMDDGVILIKTKEEAKEILEKIKTFLKNNLILELNSKTQIFKNKQGVNFCGYKINEYRLKIRDKGKRKLKKKIKDKRFVGANVCAQKRILSRLFMNEIFLIGKIVTKIEYNFIINSKKYFSKVEFEIELDKQIFKVKGYNNIADFCYRKLKKNDKVFINGRIEKNMIIKIKNIKLI